MIALLAASAAFGWTLLLASGQAPRSNTVAGQPAPAVWAVQLEPAQDWFFNPVGARMPDGGTIIVAAWGRRGDAPSAYAQALRLDRFGRLDWRTPFHDPDDPGPGSLPAPARMDVPLGLEALPGGDWLSCGAILGPGREQGWLFRFREDGTIRWKQNATQGCLALTAAEGGGLLAFFADGSILRLDEDGEMLSRKRCEVDIYRGDDDADDFSKAVIVSDGIIAAGRSGALLKIDRSGNPIWARVGSLYIDVFASDGAGGVIVAGSDRAGRIDRTGYFAWQRRILPRSGADWVSIDAIAAASGGGFRLLVRGLDELGMVTLDDRGLPSAYRRLDPLLRDSAWESAYPAEAGFGAVGSRSFLNEGGLLRAGLVAFVVDGSGGGCFSLGSEAVPLVEPSTNSLAAISWREVSSPVGLFDAPPASRAVDVRRLSLCGERRRLLVESGPGGRTSPPAGEHSAPLGLTVEIQATPDMGYEIAGWSGDVPPSSGEPSQVLFVQMAEDRRVRAEFRLTVKPPLEAAGRRHVLWQPSDHAKRGLDELSWQANPDNPAILSYEIETNEGVANLPYRLLARIPAARTGFVRGYAIDRSYRDWDYRIRSMGVNGTASPYVKIRF
jgi:hypothetical protein